MDRGVRRHGARARALEACLVLAATVGCSRAPSAKVDDKEAPPPSAARPSAPASDAGGPARFSAPLAATHVDGGVIIAGLDVPAHAIRVQRISDADVVERDAYVYEGVSWSGDAALKVLPVGDGVAVLWRGKRQGRFVGQAVLLDRELHARAVPIDVPAGACATREALWFTDGRSVSTVTGSGGSASFMLAKDDDVELVCAEHQAFALADQDSGTNLWQLAPGSPEQGQGLAKQLAPRADGALRLIGTSEVSGLEQRERAVFTDSDDLGFLRIGENGTMTFRDVHARKLGRLHKLASTLAEDDDVIGIDAHARAFVVFYTRELEGGCDDAGSPTRTGIFALRVDRSSFVETRFELARAACGAIVGPFFTGSMADGVSLAWVERNTGGDKTTAPIDGLAYRIVPVAGALVGNVARLPQSADVIVDAGCSKGRCAVVALGREPGESAMVPGPARVLRYP